MLTLCGLLDHESFGKILLRDLFHESLVQTALSRWLSGPVRLYLYLEEGSAFAKAQDIGILHGTQYGISLASSAYIHGLTVKVHRRHKARDEPKKAAIATAQFHLEPSGCMTRSMRAASKALNEALIPS